MRTNAKERIFILSYLKNDHTGPDEEDMRNTSEDGNWNFKIM